jgi:hypothetical protein
MVVNRFTRKLVSLVLVAAVEVGSVESGHGILQRQAKLDELVLDLVH